jgi:hypothetical protein
VAGATITTGVLVTQLKTFKVFLGYDWLQSVNPKINWRDQKVETEEGEVPLQMRMLQERPLDYPGIFKEVFSEEAFRGLPPQRKWDHCINLIPDHAPVRGKCYPLATREQQAMKDFIISNLEGQKI